MVSTVKARPNHYEILGVTPAATHDEIRRAFAREISALRPRAFGGVGEVSIAFETLRDPARRKAYDASIGIRPEPKPGPASIAGVGAAQFIGATLGARLERLASDDFGPGGRPAAPTPAARVSEPRTASFIASSLRSPPEAAPKPSPPEARTEPVAPLRAPPLVQRSQPEAERRAPPALKPQPAVRAPEQDFLHVEEGAFDWKRPAAIAGGMVLAVGLLGAWAGWEAGNDMQPDALPKRTVTQKLPPPPEFPVADEEAIAPVLNDLAAPPPTAPKRAIATARVERPSERPQYVALADEPAETAQAQNLVEAAVEPAAAEAEPAAVVPATMPLPHAVVARTIGRIGYSCGKVASASAVDGQAGVFKVTCTSGQSYRAAPVRGRYHFSRWSRKLG